MHIWLLPKAKGMCNTHVLYSCIYYEHPVSCLKSYSHGLCFSPPHLALESRDEVCFATIKPSVQATNSLPGLKIWLWFVLNCRLCLPLLPPCTNCICSMCTAGGPEEEEALLLTLSMPSSGIPCRTWLRRYALSNGFMTYHRV
jgi:hypothetical protein